MFFLKLKFYKRLLWLLGILSLSLCLSSIQTVPFLEFSVQSTRMFFVSQYSNLGSLSSIQLIRLVVPSLTGSATNGNAIWQGGSVIGYVGFIPFILIAYGLKRQKQYLFFLIAAIVSMIFSMGENTIFYQALKFIPIVSMFRVPTNVLFLYTFFIAMLSGLSLEYLIKNKMIFPKYFNLGWIIAFFGICAYLSAKLITANILLNIAQLPNKLESKLSGVPIEGLNLYIEQIALNFLIIGLSLTILRIISRKQIKFLNFTVVMLLCVDFYLINHRALETLPLSKINEFENQSNVIHDKNIDSNYRLYFDPSSYPSNIQKVFGYPQTPSEVKWQFYSLRPNLGINKNTRYVNGYGSMIFGPYQSYFGNTPLDPTGVNITAKNEIELDELAVKYTITRSSGGQGMLSINERPMAKPRIRLELTDGNWLPVKTLSESPGFVEVESVSTQSGILVFAETNYPGWEVQVDGVKVSKLDNLSILQKVNVPPGIHNVKFSFEPKSVLLGIYGTISGIIFVIILFGKSYFKKLMSQKIKKNRK